MHRAICTHIIENRESQEATFSPAESASAEGKTVSSKDFCHAQSVKISTLVCVECHTSNYTKTCGNAVIRSS